MYRYALESLKEWKDNPVRKPLIIKGARQVGKTWLMKEFGRLYYDEVIYLNFDSNKQLELLFSQDLNPQRLILGIELYSGKHIVPEKTLLIFDEIQEVPNALNSLKYFCEEASAYHIICAGSLLGIALHSGSSFPVGKVEFLQLYPMNFEEFLSALNMEQFQQLIKAGDFMMLSAFQATLITALKQYYFVGGMPEAVACFATTHDYVAVREIQKRILEAYEQDFSKHAPYTVVPRLRMLWQSIPSQLAKENKKFIYGLVREGSRAKDYEMGLLWLVDCGLVHKVSRVNVPRIPLQAYEDLKAFKLFLLDVGLLGCMTGISQKILLDGNSLFVEFKGALTEQYVLQQLQTIPEIKIYYYTNDRGSCEIDFLVENEDKVIPLEVKAEVNLRAKSLRVYQEKFHPELAIRASMMDYKEEINVTNIPLYAITAIGHL